MKWTLFDFNFLKATDFRDEGPPTVSEGKNGGSVDVINGSDNEMENSTKGQNNDGPSKQKKTELFQDSRLTKWPWLENTEKGMQCGLCFRHKK